MARTLLMSVLLAVVAISTSRATIANDDPRGSLLAAWEAAQRSDPATELFERVADHTYRFRTNRFPFDGEIRVLNLSVDDAFAGPGSPALMGAVELELVGLPDDFMAKHAHSYTSWMATNIFYQETDSDRWMTVREWQASSTSPWTSSCWALWDASNAFWIVLLLALLLFLLLVSRKASRQMKSAMSAQDQALEGQRHAIEMTQRALAIAEDSNRLLGEILASLRCRDDSELSD